MANVGRETVKTLALVIAAAAAACVGAAPSTQPASQPVVIKPVTPPKDWVVVDRTTSHFRFSVPKVWEQKIKADTQVTYEVPHTLKFHPSVFTVVSAECHAATVEQDAAEVRERLTNSVSTHGGKIIQDGPTTLGGRPAWAFEVQVPYDAPPATPDRSSRSPSGRGGTPKGGAKPTAAPPPVKRMTRMFEVLQTQGTTHTIVTFEADNQYYAAGLANTMKVLGTFDWAAAGAK